MDERLVFTPSDLSSVMTVADLASYLVPIIQTVRSNDLAGQALREAIDNISNISKVTLSKHSSLNTLFSAYEKIQTASLLLRNQLSNFISLDTYDSINYAFYYQGKRYSTSELKAAWLVKSSSGQLRLNLEKAVKDLDKEYQQAGKTAIQEIFKEHYESYMSMIQGTYKGTMGRKINKGHIAEAFESHIASHHPAAYKFLNTEMPLSTIEKMAIGQLEKLSNSADYWPPHESVDEGWQHIRESLGTQRGTVAGDVGRFQVKETEYSGQWSEVRLSSLTNLKTGIRIYCDIVNPDKSVEEVAVNLARYLSEPVASLSASDLTIHANESINNILSGIENYLKKSGRKNSVIHI